MSPPVLALYNEGASAFRAGEFARAKEKYEAALDEARGLRDDAGIGACFAGLGGVYQVLQEYPKALESFSAALPYLVLTGNLSAQALVDGAIGEVYSQMGDHAKAVEAFDRGLEIAERVLASASEQEKLTMLPLLGLGLGEKAIAHEKLTQFAEAVESYRRAAAAFEKVGDKWKEGLALWSAGIVLRTKMQWPREAIGLLDKAWQLLQGAEKAVDAAWARSELSWAYLETAGYKEAAAVSSEVVEMARRERIPAVAFQGYLVLAQASEGLFNYEDALKHYQAAVESIRENKQIVDPRQEAAVFWLKGKLHRLLSQYGEAIEHFHVAAARYRDAHEAKSEADVLTDLAETFFWLGDTRPAMNSYHRALRLYEERGNLAKQVEVLAALAETGWLSDETPAEDVYRYLMEGRKLLTSIRLAMASDPEVSLVEVRNQLWKRFPDEFEQLVHIWRTRSPSLRREDIATGAYLEFIIRESKRVFQSWRAKSPSLDLDYLMAAGNFYQRAGRIYLLQGSLDTAIEWLTLAEVYHTSVPYNRDLGFEWGKNWFYLGEAHRRKGNHDLALFFLNRSKLLATLLRTPEIHWVYAGLAMTYSALGDVSNAINHYLYGLGMLESVQDQQGLQELKIDVLGGAIYAYRGLVTLLLDLHAQTGDEGFRNEAFKQNERLRARAFLDMLGKSRATRFGGEIGLLVGNTEDVLKLKARIHRRLRIPNLEREEEAKLLDELDDLRNRLNALQLERAKQDQRYAQIVNLRPVTISDVQSSIGPDTILLEYSVDPEASTLWAITKDEVQVYRLPGASALPTLQQYLKTLREPLVGSDEVARHLALGSELYRSLLKPAEGQFRGKKQLIIAPDGPLYYLPFEALIMPALGGNQDGSRTLRDSGYLVKQYRISYVPSASVFVAQGSHRRKAEKLDQFPLLAFGDPAYVDLDSISAGEKDEGGVASKVVGGTRMGRLPFSAEEVHRIARVWDVPTSSEHINLGDRATIEKLRETDLSRYRMLHFATHGVMGDEVGWTNQPALVLLQARDKDRRAALLEFADVLDLKLNADLVVLSACETGLGTLREGEGIVGLTRAFMYAGASSVVVSLWRVEDQSTSLLMERFYKRLKQGQGKAEALRQAKLEVMNATIELRAIGKPEQLASPFYWAPFILVGEAR